MASARTGDLSACPSTRTPPRTAVPDDELAGIVVELDELFGQTARPVATSATVDAAAEDTFEADRAADDTGESNVD